jgi:type IV secretory pathway VirB3-like protein
VYVGSKASFIRSLMIGKVSEITGARHEPRYESIFLQGVCVHVCVCVCVCVCGVVCSLSMALFVCVCVHGHICVYVSVCANVRTGGHIIVSRTGRCSTAFLSPSLTHSHFRTLTRLHLTLINQHISISNTSTPYILTSSLPHPPPTLPSLTCTSSQLCSPAASWEVLEETLWVAGHCMSTAKARPLRSRATPSATLSRHWQTWDSLKKWTMYGCHTSKTR